MENGFAIIAASLGFFVYFLPSVVGSTRHHHNQLAIVMLNLFLGWTVLGWILSLVWACTATRNSSETAPR